MLLISKFNSKTPKLALSVIFVATLAACGGSDDPAPVAQIPVGSAVISDPYAVCDSVTIGGQPAVFQRTAAGIPYYKAAINAATNTPFTGAILAKGCTDETTKAKLSDMQSSGTTAAAGNTEVVSPVTTLIEQFVANAVAAGSTPAAAKAAAETKVAEFLGVPAADLYKDPVATPSVLKATAKLSATIELLKAAGATGVEGALNNMATEIAKSTTPATIDAALVNPTFLSAVSAPAAGSTTPALSADQISLVAAVAAKVVATLEATPTTSTNFVAQIASVVASVSDTTTPGSIGSVVEAAAAAPITDASIAAASNTAETKADEVNTTPTVTAPSVIVPPVILITGAAGG